MKYTDFDGTVYEYGYDAFGLRSSVTADGATTTYLNDPLGYGYAVASYGPNGDNHYSVSGAIAALRTGGETYYYNFNHLGSVTEITGADGTIANSYTYDHEGNVEVLTEKISNPYTYAGIFGIVNDGNGLIYDRARYVSAATDSFISPDPAGEYFDPNLYRYANNNAVIFIDITGYSAVGDAAGNAWDVAGGQLIYDVATAWIPAEVYSGIIGAMTTPAIGAASLPVLTLLGYGLLIMDGVLFCCYFFHYLNNPALRKAKPFEVDDPKLFPHEYKPYDPYDPEMNPQIVNRTPNRPMTIIEDPSGFVYEGIDSNRLSGVTTTIYFSSGKAKPSKNAAESQKWDASEFGQKNPLATDAGGQYMWMVPDGWWQVKYEKDGYETAYSDWLPVPPVQTEVNQALVSRAAAELTVSAEAGDSTVILRFDRPVQINSVTAQTVHISSGNTVLTGQFVPVDAGTSQSGMRCATTFYFRLTDGQTLHSGTSLSAIYNSVITYAGTSSSGNASKTITDLMPFSDVGSADYFYDSVFWAVNHTPQITTGTGGTLFSPNASCTRAQAVTFLWRAMGQPEPKSTVNPFADVQPGAYYYKAVLWAVENGVTNGTGATTFSPDATCTRGQIVTFMHRTEKEQEPTDKTNPFTDVSTTAYYYDAVLWAVEWGITNGTGAATFSPDATCTRGQIVTFLYRDMK